MSKSMELTQCYWCDALLRNEDPQPNPFRCEKNGGVIYDLFTIPDNCPLPDYTSETMPTIKKKKG